MEISLSNLMYDNICNSLKRQGIPPIPRPQFNAKLSNWYDDMNSIMGSSNLMDTSDIEKSNITFEYNETTVTVNFQVELGKIIGKKFSEIYMDFARNLKGSQLQTRQVNNSRNSHTLDFSQYQNIAHIFGVPRTAEMLDYYTGLGSNVTSKSSSVKNDRTPDSVATQELQDLFNFISDKFKTKVSQCTNMNEYNEIITGISFKINDFINKNKNKLTFSQHEDLLAVISFVKNNITAHEHIIYKHLDDAIDLIQSDTFINTLSFIFNSTTLNINNNKYTLEDLEEILIDNDYDKLIEILKFYRNSSNELEFANIAVALNSNNKHLKEYVINLLKSNNILENVYAKIEESKTDISAYDSVLEALKDVVEADYDVDFLDEAIRVLSSINNPKYIPDEVNKEINKFITSIIAYNIKNKKIDESIILKLMDLKNAYTKTDVIHKQSPALVYLSNHFENDLGAIILRYEPNLIDSLAENTANNEIVRIYNTYSSYFPFSIDNVSLTKNNPLKKVNSLEKFLDESEYEELEKIMNLTDKALFQRRVNLFLSEIKKKPHNINYMFNIKRITNRIEVKAKALTVFTNTIPELANISRSLTATFSNNVTLRNLLTNSEEILENNLLTRRMNYYATSGASSHITNNPETIDNWYNTLLLFNNMINDPNYLAYLGSIDSNNLPSQLPNFAKVLHKLELMPYLVSLKDVDLQIKEKNTAGNDYTFIVKNRVGVNFREYRSSIFLHLNSVRDHAKDINKVNASSLAVNIVDFKSASEARAIQLLNFTNTSQYRLATA